MSSSGWKHNPNNWQKANQRKRKSGFSITPGLKGFLCSCTNKFREKECVRDAYNLLNEFADNFLGPEQWRKGIQDEDKNESEDVDASLEKELAALKSENKVASNERRFQVIDSGANGIVFIKTTVLDPCQLAHQIVSTVAEKKMQKSKFILRLVPIEITCKAYFEDMKKAADEIFPRYFKEGGKTFSIVYNHRNNNSLSRDEVIKTLAEKICGLNETNKVNLSMPQLAVIVEVIRSICCLSVIPDYYMFKKYNILELSRVSSEQNLAEKPITEINIDIGAGNPSSTNDCSTLDEEHASSSVL